MSKRIAKMTRRAFMGAMGTAGIALAACGNSGQTEATDTGTSETATEAADGAIAGTYEIHIQGYDWGCGVDKVTFNLEKPLDGVEASDITVTEHKQATDFTDETFPVVEVDVPRTITSATLSEDGKKLDLELACAPDDGDSPLLFSMTTQFNTWSDPYYLALGVADGAEVTSEGTAVSGFAIDPAYTARTTSGDAFTTDSFEASDGVTYQYAAWTPEEASKTLVVWLHGLGEGGTENTDPLVTILANKVVALSEDEFQQTVGGAHILVPQCPTYWMDNDGKMSNFTGGAIQADGTSFYTASLEEFIDSYAKGVGAEKIVLAGCSNGGYMTMVLAINRPDAYAAVVPICEALPDEMITDDQIASLVDLPMFFVYSQDDTTVDPTLHEIPTIKRLRAVKKAAKKANKTLHVFDPEHVVDESGQFTDEDGNPYQYMGHWSWIYFDNNACTCKYKDGIGAWDFIAQNVQ